MSAAKLTSIRLLVLENDKRDSSNFIQSYHDEHVTLTDQECGSTEFERREMGLELEYGAGAQ